MRLSSQLLILSGLRFLFINVSYSITYPQSEVARVSGPRSGKNLAKCLVLSTHELFSILMRTSQHPARNWPGLEIPASHPDSVACYVLRTFCKIRLVKLIRKP